MGRVLRFAPTPDLIMRVFNIQRMSTLNKAALLKKVKDDALLLHPDKTNRDPPRVRHLCELLRTATTYLAGRYVQLNCPRGVFLTRFLVKNGLNAEYFCIRPRKRRGHRFVALVTK